MNEIKRCPFCGGEARQAIVGEIEGSKYHAIVCRMCGCSTQGWKDSKKSIETWNNRYDASLAEKAIERIVAEFEKVPTRSISIYKALKIVKGGGSNAADI